MYVKSSRSQNRSLFSLALRVSINSDSRLIFVFFFYHHFFARVALTPYCIHTWVGRPGPENQSDMLAHQNLSCNCDSFHFFQSCRPFLRAKTTLFGLKIFRARDPVCARM